MGTSRGGRKGYNPKHRAKETYRPVVCFIEETREYLTGKLRNGVTMSGQEAAALIKRIKSQLPGCVKRIVLRADGEFLSGESVAAAIEAGFDFIIANKGCRPPVDPNTWYRPWKRKEKTRLLVHMYNMNSLKMTDTPIGYFALACLGKRTRSSPNMTNEQMLKTWSEKPTG